MSRASEESQASDTVDSSGSPPSGAVPGGPLPTPDFDAGDGLLPAVVQDADTGRVRMVGYMNRAALEQTVDTGRVTFHSRSKDRLWMKGETSGNWLEAVEVRMDCDGDALLVRARPHGPTCHTGDESCFDSGRIWERRGGAESRDRTARSGPVEDEEAFDSDTGTDLDRILARLEQLVADRDRDRPEGSYTARLLEGGVRRTGRKIAEEALELALSAAGGDGPDRQAEESADLLYHLLVHWRAADLSPARVARELAERMETRQE